jgi:cytosine deaminase/N-isopropylammelide isopropylaminohydrolase
MTDTPEYDLLIRRGRLFGRDLETLADVGIADGSIVAVGESLDGTAAEELDAAGNLVSPSFVDCHKHVDRALAATGDLRPRWNEEPNPSPEAVGDRFDEYYESLDPGELDARIAENLRMAARAGTTHVRSHVAVDTALGTETMAACLRARERTSHLLDLELVPYATGDLADPAVRATVRDAVEMAADTCGRGNVYLGGSVTLVGGRPAVPSVDGTIDSWFGLAADLDVGLDVHVTVRGAAGYYVLMRLADATAAHGYEGRVNVVHAWALAHLPDWWLEAVLARLSEADISVTTCYNSVRRGMPIRALGDHDVTLGHGTDNDQDFVYAHGNADPLEAALVASYSLVGDWHFDADYRWSETNPALRRLWDLVTVSAADLVGKSVAGIEEGRRADLVVLDEPSPEWAIVRQASREAVVKDGRVVAEDGRLREPPE